MPPTIELLRKDHDRRSFESGSTVLDDWVRTKASQWSKKGLSRVYVATLDGSAEVCGYYTLSNHYVEFDALPTDRRSGLPSRTHMPTVLLGRLAVSNAHKGRGLGRFLLFDAMKRCLAIAEQVGITAMEVEADGDDARRFYLHNGMTALLDDPHHLFVSMREIRALDL